MTDAQQPNNWRPRLSLKGLFALVTAVAVVLAPYYWFGGFYLYSVGCSLFFIYLCTRRYREGRIGVQASLAMVLIAIFLVGGGIASIAFFVQIMLTAAVCIPLVSLKARPRTFVTTLVALMVAIYGVAFGYGMASIRETRLLRAQYPITSLESRLAFERQTESESAPSITPVSVSSAVAKRLDEQDDTQAFHQSCHRARSLRLLHDDAYQRFALAAGFGPARMAYIGTGTGTVDLNSADEFTLPATVITNDQLAVPQQLQNAHDTAVDDFISPERLGYIESRSKVAGFEPHRFTLLNKRWQSHEDHARYWQVVRLELIGLLRNSQPRVYIAKAIPEMEKLASTPHRELNDFEKAALPQLQSQEDIVIDEQPDRIQMLGALRAGKNCLECHHGDRGKLLGAFSYTLTPLTKDAPVPATHAAN